MIKFSVIIPAYHCEKFIHKTLDSVKAQTYKNFEVIITDDGSKDGTYHVIKRYMDDNTEMEIYLLSQSNKGIGCARNSALSRATGDYAAFLDNDDLWYPSKLERISDYLCKHPDTDLVSHKVYKVYPDGKRKAIPDCKPKEPCYRSLMLKGNTMTISGTVVRLETLLNAGGFTEDRLMAAEDYEMWLKLAFLGAKFGFVDTFLGEKAKKKENFSAQTEVMLYGVLNIMECYREKLLATAPGCERSIHRAIGRKKAGEIAAAVFKLCMKKDYASAWRNLGLIREVWKGEIRILIPSSSPSDK